MPPKPNSNQNPPTNKQQPYKNTPNLQNDRSSREPALYL